eukprot:1553433-Pyramimonas_sp.AAC.1
MRLSRASFASNPAGDVAADVPGMVADSATGGICTSATDAIAAGFGHACGGAAGSPADAAGAPAVAVVPTIMAVMRFSSSR